MPLPHNPREMPQQGWGKLFVLRIRSFLQPNRGVVKGHEPLTKWLEFNQKIALYAS